MNKREVVVQVAWSFVGKAYRWGGNGILGIDCSGLAQECLASVGLDPRGDQTADDLRTVFGHESTATPDIGCLVFFGTTRATHVAIFIGDGLMIEAGGGGKDCYDAMTAEKLGAMVRVRPVANRKDLLGYADPFLSLGE